MTYNKVILAGAVITTPEFNMDSERGDVLQVKLQINRKDIGKAESISISIYESELITKGLKEIHAGDYIVIHGRIVTTNYTKTIPIECSCGEIDYKQKKAEKTEVEVNSFEVMRNVDPMTAIGINKVFLIGNVCSALNFRPAAGTNKDYIKYKLAVNRIGVLKDEQTADYPFIVSFGKEASSANKMIGPSSELFIEGALQERIITQKDLYRCPVCNNEEIAKSKSSVREIITSKVVYLNKTKSNKEIEED